MRVSVIVPTRNRASLLAHCVARIRAQHHPDVELVVVDDGSGPAQASLNAEVVREAGGRYLRLQPPSDRGSGPSHVRNAGIRASTGALVAFCDDDDYWCDPDYLAVAVGAFEARADLDLLFANQEALSTDTGRRSTWQPQLEAVLARRGVGSQAVEPVSLAECLVSAGEFAHLNVCVVRKRVLEAIGGFEDGIRYCEDLDLFVRVADRAAAIAYLRRTVAIHNVPDRSSQDNASTRVDAQGRHLFLQQVANRLHAVCASTAARDYARRLGADACRALTHEAVAAARLDEALTWARVGGAWRQTLRWLAYTQLLRLRRLAAGR